MHKGQTDVQCTKDKQTCSAQSTNRRTVHKGQTDIQCTEDKQMYSALRTNIYIGKQTYTFFLYIDIIDEIKT